MSLVRYQDKKATFYGAILNTQVLFNISSPRNAGCLKMPSIKKKKMCFTLKMKRKLKERKRKEGPECLLVSRYPG